jgi:hypothetical protein
MVDLLNRGDEPWWWLNNYNRKRRDIFTHWIHLSINHQSKLDHFEPLISARNKLSIRGLPILVMRRTRNWCLLLVFMWSTTTFELSTRVKHNDSLYESFDQTCQGYTLWNIPPWYRRSHQSCIWTPTTHHSFINLILRGEFSLQWDPVVQFLMIEGRLKK